jgi:hypothetical protein
MQFLINEGSFSLPDGLQDHSMNMLLQGTSTLGLTLIISRAALEPGEALGGFIDRQLQSLTQQVSHLQVPERHLHQDPPNQELAAAELALEFVQNGQPVYQRQRVWLLADKVRVLVLCGSSAAAITETQKKQWLQICASFTPRS